MKHSFDTPQRGNSIHHSFGNPNASNTTRSTINIVESPDNRGSIIATTEPSSPPPPQQPSKTQVQVLDENSIHLDILDPILILLITANDCFIQCIMMEGIII